MNTKDIVILAVYGYILFYMLKPSQTTEMILLTVATFFLLNSGLSFNFLEGLENNDSVVANDSGSEPSNISSNLVTDGGASAPKPVVEQPLNMGPYDGICLRTGNKDYWMKSPEDTSLVPNDDLFTYLGSQGPLKMRLSDQAALLGPPVDGVKGSAEKKFMFANNVTSPACCPSTFTSSTGCVCTTQNQRDFIAARGVMGPESKDNEY